MFFLLTNADICFIISLSTEGENKVANLNQTKTQHRNDCSRVFKNYDHKCPRCQELMSGSGARDGWQKRHYGKLAAEDERAAVSKMRRGLCEQGVHIVSPTGCCWTCEKKFS